MLSEGQEPASNENLKIYDPDERGSLAYKAKLARQIDELRENQGKQRVIIQLF